MMPAPMTPTRCDRRAACTFGVGDAGVLLQALRHEKDGDQVARDRAADQRHERSVSTFRPSSSGRLQPLTMASRAASGAGSWPFVLASTCAASHGEGERHLLLAQADRLLLLALRASCQALDSAAQASSRSASSTQPLARHGVEDDAELTGLGRR